MGRDQSSELAVLFEHLVRQVMEQASYKIEDLERSPQSADWRVDFRCSHPGEDYERLIDVKWLPVERASALLIRELLGIYHMEIGWDVGLTFTIVVSAIVADSIKEWVVDSYGVQILDRRDLVKMAGTEYLRRELERFFQRSRGQLEKRPSADAGSLAEHLNADAEAFEHVQLAVASDPTERKLRGADLCAELRRHPAGPKGAPGYEKLCLRIFNFLFFGELSDANVVKRTDSGMDIYDIAYRITNRTRFWSSLSRDFRCRVLLVECKNYSHPIEAMQVYTTERYLSLAAMRSVCFILTRLTPKPQAYAAAQGALRENGKLIIFLTDKDLCKMLHLKDDQRAANSVEDREAFDPSLMLDRVIHRALARMPR
ncbi:hypothetical protein AMEJIAPC_01862 [Caulobacter sp. NIBR1757]|nr:hypothetical protein AMEJIAPC_01862 [Caulobacter sp. NIBR1757]